MVETLIGILITVAICVLVGWLVEKLAGTVPAQFTTWGWVIRAVFYLILIVWVLDKYGVYSIAKA